MDENELTGLAVTFETHRPHLRAVTLRLLGSPTEADDAVQETWLRLARTDVSEVENLRAWLTTVAGRVALSMLRSRGTRAESDLSGLEESAAATDDEPDPETRALQADALGAALVVVLERLDPAERLAFVLHDLFGVPFVEIATVVERSPAAARQLASRARRRVRGGSAEAEADPARRRAVVDAFLTAARDGDFAGLLAVLDPDVELRADRVAVAAAEANRGRGAPDVAESVHGAEAVARVFCGRARAAQPALLDGALGAAYAPGGRVFSAFDVVVVDGRIVAIEMIADPDVLADMDVDLAAWPPSATDLPGSAR